MVDINCSRVIKKATFLFDGSRSQRESGLWDVVFDAGSGFLCARTILNAL